MKPTAQNELGQTLQQFLDWAHTMGWRYQMAPYILAHFHRFLKSHGIERLDCVEPSLLLAYQRGLIATRSPSTVNGYLCILRALWRYLLRQDLARVDVTACLLKQRPDFFVPYLYSAREFARMERALRSQIHNAPCGKSRFCRHTRLAAFGLLRDCGLRVSEACNLNLDDYDSQKRTLRIERTKFFKTRHIPLPRSTCTLLDPYLEYRSKHIAAAPNISSALFISTWGQRLHRGALESAFTELLRELGLYQPRRKEGRTVLGSTNLHALRHSYAVRTLERWQQQKANVDHLLPLLSAIMGHADVTYTAHYLHLTPQLRQLASQRFRNVALPQLEHTHGLTEDEKP